MMGDKYEYRSSLGCNFTVKSQRIFFFFGGGGREGTCPISNTSITNLTWSADISNPGLIGNNPTLAVLVLHAVQW